MNMNIPSQRPLIVVDTDMGYDDIMAIAMLLSAGEPIAGITIVNGLAAVDSGADNMLRLLDRAGLGHIPVAVGAAAPLSGDAAFDVAWREEANTLPGLKLPATNLKPIRASAAQFLVDKVKQHPGQVTLLCLGPLTNIAMAIQEGGPSFAKGVKQIVMMGGAVRVPGNDTPNLVSEWNLYVDPPAAAQTAAAGIPITMIGLDITNQAPKTDELVNMLCTQKPANPLGRIIQESVIRMYEFLYDPVAAAYLIEPSIVQTAEIPVHFVAEGPNAGQTAEDPAGTNTKVGIQLNYPQFTQLLLRLIHSEA